jgi:hypothetical protein
MARIGRLSPTNAEVVANAYGYETRTAADRGVYVILRGREVAFVYADGEINPCSLYTRADHECAMAIRATLPLR